MSGQLACVPPLPRPRRFVPWASADDRAEKHVVIPGAAKPQPKEQAQKSLIIMKCFPRYFQRLLKPEA
jgi:hypothetical protein